MGNAISEKNGTEYEKIALRHNRATGFPAVFSCVPHDKISIKAEKYIFLREGLTFLFLAIILVLDLEQ
jgi:hypothetical protein